MADMFSNYPDVMALEQVQSALQIGKNPAHSLRTGQLLLRSGCGMMNVTGSLQIKSGTYYAVVRVPDES